jgi:predicted CoA-binding protein
MAKIVAVIGASNDRHKYGNKALRAFASRGHTVYAINPNEREVEGHKAYATVLDVPGPIDMATLYVQPDVGVSVMDDIAKKQIPEVWLNPGADDDAVVQRAQALGVKTIQACSIIGIGERPGDY